MGIAMMSTPSLLVAIARILPPLVTGKQSPYPTVVIVTNAHQKQRGIVPKQYMCFASSTPAIASSAAS